MGLCGEHADDEACGEQRAGQTVERTEGYADVLLVSGGYEYVLGDEQGGEYGRAAPRPNARGQHRHEPREGRDAHRVQADAYVEGRADGEACRYRVQAVRAVEVAVLKRIYYVEAAAPRQYQQRQHARRQSEAARDGDVCADGGYGERESEYEVRQGGEALAVAVRHDHDERHGRECRRQAVYRCGRGDEQRGVDDDEPQCGACRDAPCGDLAVGRAGILGIDAAVGPAVEAHGHVAGEDHAQDHLHQQRQPPHRRGVLDAEADVAQGVDERCKGEGHGEDRMREPHQMCIFRYGIHGL